MEERWDRERHDREDNQGRVQDSLAAVETLKAILQPPRNTLNPSTSSRLPRIDPVIEARTRSSNPSLMANTVMMSSAAFPSVALEESSVAPGVDGQFFRRLADQIC
jgi:hypothetical protein